MSLKREAEETKMVEEGKHEGEIVDVKLREGKWDYIDFYVQLKDAGVELKHGCPDSSINPQTKLGKTLSNLGFDISPGNEVEVDEAKGMEVEVITHNEETDNGVFARIDKLQEKGE